MLTTRSPSCLSSGHGSICGVRPYEFDDLWAGASSIKGWLTPVQARRLWDETSALTAGAVVLEIGSHQGRSTVVIAAALAGQGRVIAVDPFVEGRLFGGQPTRAAFEANLSTYGLSETVRLIADYSTRLRPGWDEPIDLLYVDGKHDYWTCSDDLRWAEHVRDEGTVLVHDAFSSVGVTLALLAHVLPSKRLTYVGRDGSLARFHKHRPTARDRWRIVREMPWWLRNVVVKLLLRLRLRPLARALGHQGDYDPY
jgi:predicted O-methyltransferase YrrM